jgi:tRNA pseudouridine55 synthase
MYSALKHEGQRLYDLARAGVEVERETREVVVHNIELLEFAPPRIVVEIESGRGFYVRTFAHDVGLALGCYAHMSELERRKTGVFNLDEAVSPEEWEAAAEDEAWRDLLEPPDAALRDLAPLSLDSAAERHIRNGQTVTLPATSTYAKHLEPRRAYSRDGRFLAIVRFNRPDSTWQPERVFTLPDPSPYAP